MNLYKVSYQNCDQPFETIGLQLFFYDVAMAITKKMSFANKINRLLS